MSSNIKHFVEPTFGWLFAIALIVALLAALLASSDSPIEKSGSGAVSVERMG